MNKKAFTLIEILMVIGIIVVLTTAILIGLNPAQQIAKARNSERESHLNAILNAIGQNVADNDGNFNCVSGVLPTSTRIMATSTATSTYNIGPCLVPTYLAEMPFDARGSSTASTTYWVSITDYNTGYDIMRNATTGRVTVGAPYAELGETISITR